MNRRNVWMLVLTIVGTLTIAGPFGVEAATRKFNSELMDRDLRIMEGILEDILGEGDFAPAIWGSESTKVQGTYYDGYGVLFLVEANGAMHQIRIHVTPDLTRLTETGSLDLHEADSQGGLELQKERIVEFLGSYAGAIRQLKPADQISIRIVPSDRGGFKFRSFPVGTSIKLEQGAIEIKKKIKTKIDSVRSELEDVRFEMKEIFAGEKAKAKKHYADWTKRTQGVVPGSSLHGEPKPSLVATILKKDVDAHQGTDLLKEKILFDTVPRSRRRLHIFEGILGSTLKQDEGPFGRGGSRPSGFYQKGIGCIFFVEHDLGSPLAWVDDHVNAGLQDHDSAKGAVSVATFLLSQAVADYGSTLGQVEKDEHIVINLKLKGRGGWDDAPSRMVLKVKKEMVQQYSKGKLNLRDFMKKTKWTKT
jgi:hypothetical protein